MHGDADDDDGNDDNDDNDDDYDDDDMTLAYMLCIFIPYGLHMDIIIL